MATEKYLNTFERAKKALQIESLPLANPVQINHLQAWWLQNVDRGAPLLIKTSEDQGPYKALEGFALYKPVENTLTQTWEYQLAAGTTRTVFGGGRVLRQYYTEKDVFPVDDSELVFSHALPLSTSVRFLSLERVYQLEEEWGDHNEKTFHLFDENREVSVEFPIPTNFTESVGKPEIWRGRYVNYYGATPEELASWCAGAEQEHAKTQIEAMNRLLAERDGKWGQVKVAFQHFAQAEKSDQKIDAFTQFLEEVYVRLKENNPSEEPNFWTFQSGILPVAFALQVLRATQLINDPRDRERRLRHWNPYAFPLYEEEKAYY